MNQEEHLSRRERQIMDIIHAKERATAAEVLEQLPDPPSYSAVRALLGILEDKGHLRHARDGARYVYMPLASAESARRSAMNRVVETFFHGSPAQAMASLLESPDTQLSNTELNQLQELIKKAKKEGR